jgi:hypothetical protein
MQTGVQQRLVVLRARRHVNRFCLPFRYWPRSHESNCTFVLRVRMRFAGTAPCRSATHLAHSLHLDRCHKLILTSLLAFFTEDVCSILLHLCPRCVARFVHFLPLLAVEACRCWARWAEKNCVNQRCPAFLLSSLRQLLSSFRSIALCVPWFAFHRRRCSWRCVWRWGT